MGARYAVVVAALLLAAGCSGDGAERGVDVADPVALPSSPTTDELAEHDGQPCPAVLPEPEDDPGGHGFGTDTPATVDVTLSSADQGWVCAYDPVEAGQLPGGGTTFRWERSRPPKEMTEDELAAIEDLIADVAPREASPGRTFCTADLGPRYLVVLSFDDDLTGVSVDDHSCRHVRVTDDPFARHPGEGPAPGVLDGGQQIIDTLVAAGLVREIVR